MRKEGSIRRFFWMRKLNTSRCSVSTAAGIQLDSPRRVSLSTANNTKKEAR